MYSGDKPLSLTQWWGSKCWSAPPSLCTLSCQWDRAPGENKKVMIMLTKCELQCYRWREWALISHEAFILAVPTFEHLELSLCYFDNSGIFFFLFKEVLWRNLHFICISNKGFAPWLFSTIAQLGVWLLRHSLIARLLAYMTKGKWQERNLGTHNIVRTLSEKVQIGALFLISAPGFFHGYMWHKLVLTLGYSCSCIILADCW